MKIPDLQTTDYAVCLLAFIKQNGTFSYYRADVEYWIQDSWFAYIDYGKNDIENSYFQYIQQFKIDLEEIKKAYKLLTQEKRTKQNLLALYGNLPSIYIDFDQKLYINHFYDQVLEKRLIEGWSGQYENFLDYIPQEFRYWVIEGEDIIAELSTENLNA